MDAVQAMLLVLVQLFGRGHVGQNHEFLDQPVRFEPDNRMDALDLALAVEFKAAFRAAEIQGPTMFTPGMNHPVQSRQILQCRQMGIETLARSGVDP